ncbi:MAG: hypothetical protein P4L55_19380 [Syntrophobacteraceae bacterium]|nr:hypothetical protein [Syntrophobacteraceae bacterium]
MEIEQTQAFENIPSVEPAAGSTDGGEQAVACGVQGYFRKVTQGLSREMETESREFVCEQLKALSVKLDDVAEVLANTAKNFREKEKNGFADMVEAGSEAAARLSGELREKYAERIASGVEEMVRNRSWILLGGGVLAAGMLIWGLSSRKESGKTTGLFGGPGGREEQPYGPH